MKKDKKFTISLEEAKSKAAKYCVYRERCHQEVREKLLQYGITKDQVSSLLEELEEENFINEARYARAFALDKFRQNKWGKNKIVYKLREKGLSEDHIHYGINQIDPGEYTETAKKLVQEKQSSMKFQNPLEIKHKTTRFLLGKGFEWDLVEKLLDNPGD